MYKGMILHTSSNLEEKEEEGKKSLSHTLSMFCVFVLSQYVPRP